IRMQFAFNHLHIFCDPDPDIAKSYAERSRLFKERGGWDSYNTSLLSTGGAIFDRSAKSIKVSTQVKKVLAVDSGTLPPDEPIGARASPRVAQHARVEYGPHGGRSNTEFTDNRAGVDCCDHDANNQPSTSDVMTRRKVSNTPRNHRLEQMREDLAELVADDG